MAPCRASKPSLSIRHAHQRRRASVTTNSANPGSAVETTEAAVEGAVETVKEKVEEAASTVKEVVGEGVEEVAKVIPSRGVLERCESFRASRGGNLKADPLRIIMFQVHVHLNAKCAVFHSIDIDDASKSRKMCGGLGSSFFHNSTIRWNLCTSSMWQLF